MVFFLRRKSKGGPGSKDLAPGDSSSLPARQSMAKDDGAPRKKAKRSQPSGPAQSGKGNPVRPAPAPTPLQEPSVIRLADRLEAGPSEDEAAVPGFRLPASSISVGSMEI